ncbi:hypothetical protein PYCCODRAFT_915131 [Trametes coccinea BRFM310]|uniref:Uncharacterized protein n=1 Tax=Trametes coccinea (strain BRFM310) TaxID=1353009 RepID=A0A1Y2ICJ7_TRAC3|nr:hypothetical protein PYCCODRAFT_915131 [Trametes coccinea BRFM310]
MTYPSLLSCARSGGRTHTDCCGRPRGYRSDQKSKWSLGRGTILLRRRPSRSAQIQTCRVRAVTARPLPSETYPSTTRGTLRRAAALVLGYRLAEDQSIQCTHVHAAHCLKGDGGSHGPAGVRDIAKRSSMQTQRKPSSASSSTILESASSVCLDCARANSRSTLDVHLPLSLEAPIDQLRARSPFIGKYPPPAARARVGERIGWAAGRAGAIATLRADWTGCSQNPGCCRRYLQAGAVTLQRAPAAFRSAGWTDGRFER